MAVIVASVHHFLTFWNIPSWAVAFGTVFLGGATVWLGKQARNEAGAVAKQADAVAEQAKLTGDQLGINRQQLEASQRPFVLPVTAGWRPTAWMPGEREFDPPMGSKPEPWMMLSNAGTGLAYNVTGALFWEGGIGGGWQLVATSVPAGRDVPVALETDLRYDVKWAEAIGYLRYLDLTGTEWQTRFHYWQNPVGQYWVEVIDFGKTSDLGEPDYKS